MKIKSNKSFTLLEIIITVALISIGIVAVVRCISIAISSNYAINVSITALNLAQQKMENFFNTDYSSVTVGSASETPSGFSDYSRSWTITETTNPDNAVSLYKTVSVTVTSTAMRGQSQSVTLVSYITNQTPYG